MPKDKDGHYAHVHTQMVSQSNLTLKELPLTAKHTHIHFFFVKTYFLPHKSVDMNIIYVFNNAFNSA